MDETQLEKVKRAEFDILKVFVKFCEEHELKYSLFAGTALGAVRHKGFIPWDDDIDICMERNEYEKFRALWDCRTIENCFLQSKKSKGYYLNHEKIRSEDPLYKGIWIDIFPLDKAPIKKSKRKKFMRKAKLRLVYSRNYPYTGGGKFLELVSKMLLALPKGLKRRIKNSCEKYIRKFGALESGYEYVCLTSPDDIGYFYPETVMRELEDIEFEGATFKISSEYDTMLKVLYGDYMTLPPEEERVSNHEIDLGWSEEAE